MHLNPQIYINAIYAAVLGLVVGSYLNVLVYRLPLAKSTVLPRSRCPYCSGSIRARDNIPLVSFLLLRRRCRRCGAPISWRYPLIEALTGLLFVLCLSRFGFTLEALASALFGCLMILLAAIDLEHFLLPDRITLSGIVAGLALQLIDDILPSRHEAAALFSRADLLEALVGALAGAGALILLINFWYWLRGEEGMGMGDVNMMALVGAFLGWKGALTALVLSATSGALVGIGLMVTGRLGMRSKLPFGVFIAFGGLMALFLGDRLIDHYSLFL
ncbi:MAG: A24 family peptidase [Thermoanaerobaculia bacterium]